MSEGEPGEEEAFQCASCGRTESKKWYGRKGQDRYCTLAKCKRARQQAAAAMAPAGPPSTITCSRKRQALADRAEGEEACTIFPPWRVSRIYSCLGMRCAPCPFAASLPHSCTCRRRAANDIC